MIVTLKTAGLEFQSEVHGWDGLFFKVPSKALHQPCLRNACRKISVAEDLLLTLFTLDGRGKAW